MCFFVVEHVHHFGALRLGGALRDFKFIMKIRYFLIWGIIWYLEGFGSMENTPTGCGSDLPTILRILKKTENREV